MLKNLEKIKMYREVKNILENSERYDKNKNVVSVKEILELLRKRFYVMQEILSPVRDSLKKYIDITNLYFAKGMDDSSCIIVEYQEDGIFKYFTISQYDKDDIEISFSLYNIDCNEIVKQNKQKINLAFEESYQRNFDHEIQIPSTSDNFIVNCCSSDLDVCGKQRDEFDLEFIFNNYPKGSMVHSPSKFICMNKDIKSELMNGDNLQKFLKNMKVYEENVPKYLKKVK